MNLTKREAYDIALDMWKEISEKGCEKEEYSKYEESGINKMHSNCSLCEFYRGCSEDCGECPLIPINLCCGGREGSAYRNYMLDNTIMVKQFNAIIVYEAIKASHEKLFPLTIQEKAIAHYRRMQEWVRTQDECDETRADTMLEAIGENWYADYCAYCKECAKDLGLAIIFKCSECPLGNGQDNKNCCGYTWVQMSESNTWGKWLERSEKVVEYIKEHGGDMQYRIKTEQEFIDEFGEDWKSDDNEIGEGVDWIGDMDYLFGNLLDDGKQFYNGSYYISKNMITDKPLPKEENKVKENIMDIYKYGDRILVWDNDDQEEEAVEGIFITFGEKGKVICVDEDDEENFKEGYSFQAVPWDNHKPLKVEDKYKPEKMIGKIIKHKDRQYYYTIIRAEVIGFATEDDFVYWTDFDKCFELID